MVVGQEKSQAAAVEHCGQHHSEAIEPDHPEVIDSTEEQGFAVFDIETGPQDDDTLRRLCPEFVPPPHPGEFDAAAVKCGNLGAAKAAEKIEKARADHAAAVASYAADVERAKVDHFESFKSKAALDATTGRVVAIGCSDVVGVPIIDCDKDESEGLKKFWLHVQCLLAHHCPMVGFNIHKFDLPFLVRRSWILGVPVPSGVRQGRYWNTLFIDLMKVWAFDERELISLDDLAAAFNLPGKVLSVKVGDELVDVCGADFHKLWRSNRQVAQAYLVRDLELPGRLAMRMGVI